MGKLLGLFYREWRLLWVARARLLPLAVYPVMLMLVTVFATDLRLLESDYRNALVLIVFVLSQLTLAPVAWREDIASGALGQLALLQTSLLPATWAKYLTILTGISVPVTALVLVVGKLFLDIDLMLLALPMFLALPVLVGLLLFSAALTQPVGDHAALPALLLVPLYVPVIILMSLATSGPENMAGASLWWLGALAVLSLGLLPFAMALALRQSLSA